MYHVRRNAIAYLALFVALGGTSYAALKLPRNSVKAKQIAKEAVRSGEVKDGALLAQDFKAGQLPAGEKGDKGDRGDAGTPGTSVFASSVPSGQTVVGTWLASDANAPADAPVFGLIQLPVAAPVGPPAFKITFGTGVGPASGSRATQDEILTALNDGVESETCTGSAPAPTAPAGEICIYITQLQNVDPGTVQRFNGVGGGNEGLEGRLAALVRYEADATGSTYMRGTWAYTAP